jgi:hypothetical protein
MIKTIKIAAFYFKPLIVSFSAQLKTAHPALLNAESVPDIDT